MYAGLFSGDSLAGGSANTGIVARSTPPTQGGGGGVCPQWCQFTGDAIANTPSFSGRGMNGPYILHRTTQDPSVQRQMSSRTQNVEVLIQQVIMYEQSDGRMEDFMRSDQRCRDSAMNQRSS